MRLPIVAAFALLGATSLRAQSGPAIADLTTVPPIAGNWTYARLADGSEAVFSNASNYPQLWVHCTRAARRVSISRPAAGPSAAINVWTSSATRAVASSFSPATGRLTIEFGNYDPLLDAVATSRGRMGFAIGSGPPLVVPAWPEVARVIEDCRT